jgi:hypothetical protein
MTDQEQTLCLRHIAALASLELDNKVLVAPWQEYHARLLCGWYSKIDILNNEMFWNICSSDKNTWRI